jgi:hypothetical protein
MPRKIIKPAAVTGALLAAMLAVPATAALAAPAPHVPHNECRSWELKEYKWPHPTEYKVAAECSYINPGEKARGVLDIVGRIDEHTPWFTETGVVYTSPTWRTPGLGIRGTRMEYAPR